MESRTTKFVTLFKRIIIAIALAFLLLFLGFFGNIGYQVISVKELPYPLGFRTYGTYAVGRFYCDIVYNPILYPYYWLVGAGHLMQNVSMVVYPDYGPGEQAYPIFPRIDIRETDLYVTTMIIWGTAPNAIFLLFITLFLEIIGRRIIYLILMSGTLGFALGSIIGTVVASAIGASIIIYLSVFNKPKMEMLRNFWHSLWE
jgi:hypothetical protein